MANNPIKNFGKVNTPSLPKMKSPNIPGMNQNFDPVKTAERMLKNASKSGGSGSSRSSGSGNVIFEDYSMQCKTAIHQAVIAFLHAAAGEIVSQTQRNYDSAGRVDTGQTKGSFTYQVDDGEQAAYIGSNYENAIWEEFGTGIHALQGNGRKTPWTYKDKKTGKWYTTHGKTGHRPFFKAFSALKSKIIKEAENALRGL